MKVFVSRLLPNPGLSKIKENFETRVWEEEYPPKADQIIEQSKNCEGLVTLLSDPISNRVIEKLPKLKIIAQYAVGYDNIDIVSATKSGIIVTNTPGVLTETTADLTWALILSTSRRIVEADKYVKGGNWKVAWGPQLMTGMDIHGSTLGIIGLGRIGAEVARRAKGFSMNIIYTSRSDTQTTRAIEAELEAKRVDLETLLKQSDIISIHVPLTNETNNMIGAAQFDMMKENVIIINTSRGPVIDESALIEALKNKKIRGAGLDVFKNEPIDENNPLLKMDNVVLLPHIGSASVATRAKMADIVFNNLMAFKNREIPPNVVNREVIQNGK